MFWLFLIIFSILIIPKIFTLGIFVDGMTYASISRNLSEGIGSFLKPTYTLTIYKEFYEHPPLQFYLESLFFKLLKDNFWTERIYSVLVGFLSILMLYFILKILNKFENRDIPKFSASFILISMPLTSWIMLNNMLENTLTLFLLISFFFLLLSIYKNPLLSIISGIFLFLAFFTKGPVALFLITLPFLYYNKISLRKLLLIFLLLMLGFSIFLLFPDIINYLKIYIKKQVLNSVLGHREIVGSRLDPISKTIRELLVPFSFLFLISFIKKFNIKFDEFSIKFLVFSSIGVFPLMISPKQMDWYVYPSFPFFSIFISFIFVDCLKYLDRFFNKKPLKIVSIFTFLICCIFMFLNYGKIKNYAEFHNDFKNSNFKVHKVVGVCPTSLMSNWVVIALSQRYLKLSFSENVDSIVFASKECKLSCKEIYPKNYKNYYICRTNFSY